MIHDIQFVHNKRPFKKKDVRMAFDFNKHNAIMRRKKRKRKREVNRKKQEDFLLQEQASRAKKAVRYSKEMRNREALRQEARLRQVETSLTPTKLDDMLIKDAISSSSHLDKLVYNIGVSESVNKFGGMLNNIANSIENEK